MTVTAVVTKVEDVGGDHVVVTGTVDGVDVQAPGWVSAHEHHYGPEAYDDAGQLVDGAVSRAMTTDEQMAYWQQLLIDNAPHVAAPRVLFGGD